MLVIVYGEMVIGAIQILVNGYKEIVIGAIQMTIRNIGYWRLVSGSLC